LHYFFSGWGNLHYPHTESWFKACAKSRAVAVARG
jgi:hypothetical protein